MTDAPKNLEYLTQNGSHPFDITILDKPGGVPIQPSRNNNKLDKFDPTDPLRDDPLDFITPSIKIWNDQTQVFTTPPGGYNPPSIDALTYAGTTGKFLASNTGNNTRTSADLAAFERWAIYYETQVNGTPFVTWEFFTVVTDGSASYGTAGYASVGCVREELVQGLKTDGFTIAAAGQATTAAIILPDRTTQAIVEVERNGAVYTAYTFNRLDKLTFSPALTVGDIVRITRDTKVSDTRINNDSVVISNIINSILATRYTVPFDMQNIPPIIQSASCALTAMRIRERLFGSTGQTPGDPHAIREWDIWMNLLRGIAAGEQELVGIDGIAIEPKNRGFASNTRNTRPIFSLEDEVDINRIPAGRDYPIDSIDGYRT